MDTPLIAGLAVAAAAYAGKYGIQAWQAFKARPPAMRKFYEGGFLPTMTRREAAQILSVRYYSFFLYLYIPADGLDMVDDGETLQCGEDTTVAL
ncbi:hypothetical protein RIF29_19902 [Crotalaria pallida]|uniref:Uncharacterized protein n=1 Tax=Crotalaria pallida TaxID=3830 RepID=A0AAN9I854_CROPI